MANGETSVNQPSRWKGLVNKSSFVIDYFASCFALRTRSEVMFHSSHNAHEDPAKTLLGKMRSGQGLTCNNASIVSSNLHMVVVV